MSSVLTSKLQQCGSETEWAVWFQKEAAHPEPRSGTLVGEKEVNITDCM